MHIQCRSALDQARTFCQNAVVNLHYAIGDSMISRVRNNQISDFVNNSQAEWFMTIDSDIYIHQRTAQDNVFDRLLAHNLGVVGGLYAKKVAGDKFRCASVPIDGHLPAYNEGLIEMQWLSSGCMLVRRPVIMSLIENHPEIIYHGDGRFLMQERYALYMPGISESEIDGKPFRKYLSEDWSFCLRLQLAGHQIWADTSVLLTHVGEFGYNMWSNDATGISSL
uniref:Putative methyltransferase n=1 Tax=viral metagenome TaxID=1070528 RepID=A0A6M3IG34_9ZZZZ